MTGLQLPMLGLGTWQLTGTAASRSVAAAIDLGYRHIDTATGYGNEKAVGAGLQTIGMPRGELTIVTKFPEECAGAERQTLQRSLDALGIDYLDLWLLHGPASDPDRSAAIWQHFLAAKDEGLARHIGVSNFSVVQIDELAARTAIPPEVNQIAFGPYYFESALQPDHNSRGVTVVAHSPFSENKLDHPVLHTVARQRQCSVYEVILAWHAAHHIPVVARSSDPHRLAVNLRGVEMTLTAGEVATIDAIGIS